jgi:oxygen-dependent protoporphyrinogen oxidase
LDGFGFVVPGLEGRAVTGCTFCHVKFDGRAPRDRVLFRAFVGGEALRLSDAELLNRVRGDLRDYLGAEGEPLFAHLRRYPAAMPQYGLGHLERVAAIFDRLKRFHPGLTLAGNSYGGIGLPDAVASGESAAETALRPGRPAPVPESVA